MQQSRTGEGRTAAAALDGQRAQAPRTTLLLVFMNSFKIGVIAALIADALKLQG